MIAEVRDAVTDDLPGIVDLAAVVDPPEEGGDVEVGYYAHLIQHGRLATAQVDGIPLGYAGVLDIAGSRHLSDLFVHPDAHGQGIGRALLEEVWDDAARATPRQTFSSRHPSALPLYVRSGMVPRWPLLYVRGNPAALPTTAFHMRGVESSAAATQEAEWLGWDRHREYEFWGNRSGARCFVVLDGSTRVAVGCLKRSRREYSISHLAAVDASVMSEVICAASRWGGDDLLVAVPGENSVLSTLLDAGWRVIDQDTYCASEPDLVEPARLLPHGGLL